MTGASSLTILRSASGKPQAKHHTRLATGTVTSTKIATETLWRHARVEVSNIYDLAHKLKRLADDELAVVIRDEPAPHVDTTRPIYRRKAECIDVARCWAMLDIDDLVAPHLDVVEEPELAAHFIRDELATYAPELEGVAMFLAWSGSCGIRDRSTLKAHVWLMLDRPLTGDELKRWARSVNARAGRKLLDESIFDRVHIHFNARPSCVGFPDPFAGERRFVLLRGEPTAAPVVPAFDAPSPRAAGAGDAPIGEIRGFDARLERIGAEGVNAETMAAIGAVVRELGAERAEGAKASILARIEERIRETRDPARAAEHIGRLDGMFDRVVANQRAHDEEATRATPTYSPRGVSLDEAQARVGAAVDGWMRLARERKAAVVSDAQERRLAKRLAKAAGEEPVEAPPLSLPPAPRHALRVDAGVGKTAAVVARVAKDRRDGVEAHRLRVGYLVPRHKLGDQLRDDLGAAGVDAAVWRGVDADDPDAPGSAMCLQPDLAHAALGLAQLDVACGVCPSSATCGYQRQRARPEAEVEVAAHNFLFSSRAPSRLRSVDAVVVDEGFWSHAIEGVDEGEDRAALLLSTLDAEPVELPIMSRVDLVALRAKLRRAMGRAIEAGELRREHLLDEGLTLDELTEARRLEWMRKPKVELTEGASIEELVAELHRIRQESSFTTSLPGFWTELRRFLDTGADVAGAIEPLAELKLGRVGSGPGVRFARRRELADWLAGKPLLVMDATMPLPIVRELIERVELVADVEVSRPPEVRVAQLVDPLPISALVDGEGRAKAKLRDVADRVEILARRWNGQGSDGCDLLVVSTIAVEAALRELLAGRGIDVAPQGGSPRRHAVELRHYGDLEGENAFSGVRGVVAVGWPLPPAGAVERQAAALTGRRPHGAVGAGAYPMAQGGVALREGAGMGVEMPRHADELVEAMRWALTEGRMVQAIDRARAVRRGPGRPLDLVVLAPVPLPGLVVDRAVRWADVEVSRLELAASRWGGVLPLRPDDLARSGLWPSVEAAERAAKRERGDNAFRGSLLKGLSPLSRRYRHPGQRAWSSALVDPELPADRVVELLRAATGEPGLVVELAPPPPRPRGSFASSTREAAPPPPPSPRPAPPVVAETAPVPARGRALVAASSIFCRNLTSGKRRRSPGVELPVEPELLRTELRRRGLTLDVLAKRAKVSRPHLSNALAGRFRLSQEAAGRLFDELLALPPPPDDLLSWRAPGAS